MHYLNHGAQIFLRLETCIDAITCFRWFQNIIYMCIKWWAAFCVFVSLHLVSLFLLMKQIGIPSLGLSLVKREAKVRSFDLSHRRENFQAKDRAFDSGSWDMFLIKLVSMGTFWNKMKVVIITVRLSRLLRWISFFLLCVSPRVFKMLLNHKELGQ